MSHNRKLVYSIDEVVKDLYIGNSYRDLTISGRIYTETKKSWFGSPKTKYYYNVSIPFIKKPFYDEERNTNRILKVYSVHVIQKLIDKIQELKENERNNNI